MLLDEYTKEQFEGFISPIDTATADDLYDFFSYRTPVDNFEHFLKQTAREYNDQYIMMLKDESVEYDAMVTDYIERLTKNKTTENGSTVSDTSGTTGSTTTTTNSGTDTTVTDTSQNTTETPNTTTTEDTTSSTTGKRTNTGTQTDAETGGSSGSENTHSGEAAISKTNPMSVSYSDFNNINALAMGYGMPTKLTWNTVDGQSQTNGNSQTSSSESNHRDNTRTDNLTEDTSGSGTGKTTTAVSGTNTTAATGKQTTTTNRGTSYTTKKEDTNSGKVSDTTTNTTDSRATDRYTGRHGYSPAELLQKSRDYILLMKSFRWLCEKFNHCFTWDVEL